MCQFYILFLYTKWLILIYKLIGYKKPHKDVLYLECFTEDGAGYTYRVKHWMDLLIKDSLKVEAKFIVRLANDFFKQTDSKNLQIFLIRSIIIRIKQIQYSRNFKTVVVRRNLLLYNQYGNHFMEKLLVSAHPNRVLDFDDDIGATVVKSKKISLFNKFLMANDNHFYDSFKYYSGFITGSKYLLDLVKIKYNNYSEDNVLVMPTCVYYTDLPQKQFQNSTSFTFGWIGGDHNLYLLHPVVKSLNTISKNADIKLNIMAGVKAYPFEANFPIHFEQYSLENEVDFLRKMDVGLMPLEDTPVNRGKCGFKLLQYMGVGVPGIASAVTVNNEIIEDDVNGWLVEVGKDWDTVLKKVISNKNNLSTYGNKARETVAEKYSFKANYHRYKKYISQFE